MRYCIIEKIVCRITNWCTKATIYSEQCRQSQSKYPRSRQEEENTTIWKQGDDAHQVFDERLGREEMRFLPRIPAKCQKKLERVNSARIERSAIKLFNLQWIGSGFAHNLSDVSVKAREKLKYKTEKNELAYILIGYRNSSSLFILTHLSQSEDTCPTAVNQYTSLAN